GFIGSPPMNFILGNMTKSGDAYVFECEGFKFEVPKDLTHLLEAYVGKEITFGIRPEDIWDPISADWVPNKLRLTTTIDFREIIGAETYLYVHVGKTNMVARVSGTCDRDSGNYDVIMNLGKLHFFDPATQLAII
ncbi:MAG: sugar ABC transporter ATP-binding protein, partial [bacterium]